MSMRTPTVDRHSKKKQKIKNAKKKTENKQDNMVRAGKTPQRATGFARKSGRYATRSVTRSGKPYGRPCGGKSESQTNSKPSVPTRAPSAEKREAAPPVDDSPARDGSVCSFHGAGCPTLQRIKDASSVVYKQDLPMCPEITSAMVVPFKGCGVKRPGRYVPVCKRRIRGGVPVFRFVGKPPQPWLEYVLKRSLVRAE